MTTPETVQAALSQVIDPLLGQNLVALGLVQEIQAGGDGRVLVRLLLPTAHWPAADALSAQVQALVAALPGVAAVEVQWTAEPAWTPHRLASWLQTPLNLPANEPAPATRQSHGQRLLQRLLGRQEKNQ